MSNTLGQKVKLTLFGESHGESLGLVIDGLFGGIKIDIDFIKSQLSKRRPSSLNETSRIEPDNFKIISGIFNGYTTGDPLCVLIENSNINSKDYLNLKTIARPSHADYTTYIKSNGFNDYRGGGHTSGRLTAAIVLGGAILIKALEKKNIYIGTHIKKCGNSLDKDFSSDLKQIEEEVKDLQEKSFKVINNIEVDVNKEIEKVRFDNDSIGGILQTAIVNLPVGLGNPWFNSVEGAIANAVLSIGGVKGIEFGEGFNFANLTGKTANDPFDIVDDKIITTTNKNGGINGGITNGMPIVFNTVIKPTPSIASKQQTVNFVKKEVEEIFITGRHDPAIIRRICVVLDSICAFVVADLLSQRYGDNFLDFED